MAAALIALYLVAEGNARSAGVRSGEAKLMEDDDAAPFHGTQQRADNGGRVELVE